ncbi:MAG: DUF1801 domain-containing protein [Sediminibacterium sp.]|nr:DUF1801 domain-containing protein [Sediminibacterium sp.]MBX9781585.1 DUF1801 domain-containing protein [Chitinophagaceae bacterium]
MAKKETNLTLGVSEPEKVDKFIQELNHPLKDIVTYVRKLIMSIDNKIGEGIYWNAPTFFFTGQMKPFEPKEYKRYIVGFIFNRQDCIRMVFLQGATVKDNTNILEGEFKDNRKLIVFKTIEDAKNKEKGIKDIIKQLLKQMN